MVFGVGGGGGSPLRTGSLISLIFMTRVAIVDGLLAEVELYTASSSWLYSDLGALLHLL